MRSIINFFMRFGTIFLFLIFEGISLYLIVQYNQNQKTIFNHTFLVLQGNVQERYQSTLDYLALKEEIEQLRKENARLRKGHAVSVKIDTVGKDSVVWQDSVLLYDFIPARVISNSLHFRHNNITLDEGSKQGIEEGMGVISDEGVVGVIRSTTKNYSSVIPLIHVNSSISAMIKRNSYFGNLEWRGGDHRIAILTAVPKHADVAVGDTVVTSGYSTIFPPGQKIGKVRNVELPPGSNFYDIEVSLFVNFGKLQNVYAIESLFSEEIRQLEKEAEEYE